MGSENGGIIQKEHDILRLLGHVHSWHDLVPLRISLRIRSFSLCSCAVMVDVDVCAMAKELPQLKVLVECLL